jgi:hypothetical protein
VTQPPRKTPLFPARFALVGGVWCMALLACADEPTARLPVRESPAVVLTRDENVAFQASAFVELHVWLIELATHPELHAPRGLEASRATYTRIFDDTHTDSLARRTTKALAACEDRACAKAALGPSGLSEAFDLGLSWFTTQAWGPIFARTDKGLSRLRAALPETMPHLVGELFEQLGAKAPPLVRLNVVHASTRYRDDPYAPLALEDGKACMRGDEANKASALACALYQVALDAREDVPFSKLLEEAATSAKDGADEAHERARAHHAYAVFAAHAARLVTRAVYKDAREPFTEALLEGEPEAASTLARHWKARTSGEVAKLLLETVPR